MSITGENEASSGENLSPTGGNNPSIGGKSTFIGKSTLCLEEPEKAMKKQLYISKYSKSTIENGFRIYYNNSIETFQ